MNAKDKRLGMDRAISRRDFLDGSLRFASGLGLAGMLPSAAVAASSSTGMRTPAGLPEHYPPAGTNLRGSHPGSFEVAHQLAWEGRSDWGQVRDVDAEYDLVVVGAGISGLSAAWFYRRQHPDARILILENHDDFGGHAKRNEFTLGASTILGYGGSQSLEAPSAYSEVATTLLEQLGVNLEGLAAAYDQSFYKRHGLASTIHFDKASFGTAKNVRSQFLDGSAFLPLADSGRTALQAAREMPLTEAGRAELVRLLTTDEDLLADHSIFDEPDLLGRISYRQFITENFGVRDAGVLKLLQDMPNSYFGHGIDSVPALYALAFGMPGLGGTSLGSFETLLRKVIQWTTEPYIYHFPDGNASVARLLVRDLIPAVAPGSTMEDVVAARFDYTALDTEASATRLRLQSTVVNVAHDGNPAAAKFVHLTYIRNGKAERVRAKHSVLACYNMAIPYLCPELPEEQKQALKQLVKIPLVYTNVLLNNWRAFEREGLGLAYSPGRWHRLAMLDFPVSLGDYRFAKTPDDPIMLHMNRAVTDGEGSPEEQSRRGRYELLGKTFESFELEVRDHLAEMLGSAGFDPARDISAITVNRWPHGYAWNANPLANPPEVSPNETGRRPFHRVTIANSDAGARAYLDCAIDEAWRAVEELG